MILLTVDIETIPGANPPELEVIRPEDYIAKEGTHPKNLKDVEKIKAWYIKKGIDLAIKQQEDQAKAVDKQIEGHSKQSFNSLEGQIVCIGYKIESLLPGIAPISGVVIDSDEQKVMQGFSDILTKLIESNAKYTPILWIGHNLAKFDIPYIFHKAIKYNCKLKNYLPKSNKDYFDTMKQWAPTDYNRLTSLKKIAKFLGIDQSGTDGSMVWDMWKDGKLEDIAKYCAEDVEITNQVYKLIK
jgi:DNA polymerase elongation subunit (family B)